jgi:hypothetical protein
MAEQKKELESVFRGYVVEIGRGLMAELKREVIDELNATVAATLSIELNRRMVELKAELSAELKTQLKAEVLDELETQRKERVEKAKNLKRQLDEPKVDDGSNKFAKPDQYGRLDLCGFGSDTSGFGTVNPPAGGFGPTPPFGGFGTVNPAASGFGSINPPPPGGNRPIRRVRPATSEFGGGGGFGTSSSTFGK